MQQHIEFPVYKIRNYEEMEKTPLGKVKIRTITGEWIVDDISIEGDSLGKRRLHIPAEVRYKLGDRVDTLRQMIKYPGGTIFIDNKGYLFKYTKGSERFLIESKPIIKKELVTEGTILHIKDLPSPQLIPYKHLAENIKYASIIFTNYGPFVYDYTSEPHEPYRRSI